MALNQLFKDFLSGEPLNTPLISQFVDRYIAVNPDLYKTVLENNKHLHHLEIYPLFVKKLIYPDLDYILNNIPLPEAYYNGRYFVFEKVSKVAVSEFISKEYLNRIIDEFNKGKPSKPKKYDPLDVLFQYFCNSQEIRSYLNQELFKIFLATGEAKPKF